MYELFRFVWEEHLLTRTRTHKKLCCYCCSFSESILKFSSLTHSYGRQPYENLVNEEVFHQVVKGLRLQPAPDTPERVAALQTRCFQHARPRFVELFQELQQVVAAMDAQGDKTFIVAEWHVAHLVPPHVSINFADIHNIINSSSSSKSNKTHDSSIDSGCHADTVRTDVTLTDDGVYDEGSSLVSATSWEQVFARPAESHHHSREGLNEEDEDESKEKKWEEEEEEVEVAVAIQVQVQHDVPPSLINMEGETSTDRLLLNGSSLALDRESMV